MKYQQWQWKKSNHHNNGYLAKSDSCSDSSLLLKLTLYPLQNRVVAASATELTFPSTPSRPWKFSSEAAKSCRFCTFRPKVKLNDNCSLTVFAKLQKFEVNVVFIKPHENAAWFAFTGVPVESAHSGKTTMFVFLERGVQSMTHSRIALHTYNVHAPMCCWLCRFSFSNWMKLFCDLIFPILTY